MLAMTPEEEHVRAWGLNCLWFIAFVVLAIMLAIAANVVVKWMLQSSRRRRAREEAARNKYDLHGKPYPPHGRGICRKCSCAEELVYYLPDGQQLCRECYLESIDEQPRA